MQQTSLNETELLAAILPQPSGQIEINRFQQADAARCGSECNGHCSGIAM